MYSSVGDKEKISFRHLIFCVIPEMTYLLRSNYVNKHGITRADQNMGGTPLEFPMRTVMHGKSRDLSAISVCDN